MISLVVPVFNMEQYLSRCMERLLNQNGDYEIILIDDGSTDYSAKLCDGYAAEHPHLVRVIHKENEGLSSARNAGIDAAKGEFVIFPDPDDWVELNFVSQLMELQEQYHPDLLCIGHYVDSDMYSVPANKGQVLQQIDGAQAQKALLVSPCISGFAWNKLYHLDIIHSNGLRFWTMWEQLRIWTLHFVIYSIVSRLFFRRRIGCIIIISVMVQQPIVPFHAESWSRYAPMKR